MKLFKKNLLVLLVITNSMTFGQNNSDSSFVYYNLGIKMYLQNKNKEADSLLTISANMFPHPDTYYYLALTKRQLKDSCGFCQNLRNAEGYGHNDAPNMYNSDCFTKKIINYNNSLHPDSAFNSVLITNICTKKTEQQFNIINLKNNKITTFYIISKDSAAKNDESFLVTFPDLKKISSERILFEGPDKMPEYPGGDDARINFLATNIKYPKSAAVNRIQGEVYVNFILEEDGQVTYVRVSSGIGGGCDEEAIRVVKMMPKWIPAKRGDKPVRVKFSMPIRFTAF